MSPMAARRRTSPDAPLDERLREYLARMPALRDSSRPSLFWERQLERLRAEAPSPAAAQLTAQDLELVVRSLGYGFEDLEDDAGSARDDERFAAATANARRIGRLAKGFGPIAMDVTGNEWEHAASLRFLDRHGVIDEYVALLDTLGVRSSMSAARHFWYQRQVRELIAEHAPAGPLDVLEIGAGAGNLAVMLHEAGLVRSYTIVDLPELLAHSAYTLSKYVADADLRFGETPGRPGAVTLLTPEQAVLVEPDSIDVALNFNSFMEMDLDTRDGYLELIYGAGRPGALFVNVNRRQRGLPGRDGAKVDSNPLLYPYRASDRVLLWEEDEFQTITRMRPGRLSSLAIVRAALLGP
jgi:hypothetical protein